MTVIAWDGKELVGDRMTHMCGTPLSPVRKVFRLRAENGRVALVGFSGHVGYASSYLAWMRGGEEPVRRVGEDLKFSILLIEAPGKIWYRCDVVDRWDVLGSDISWAIGSGCDYALGAMRFGATAREAVRVASTLDNQCGYGCDAVRF